MNNNEIRESQIRELLDKVRKRNYGSYLRSALLKKIRQFEGATINFDFPVTALVGPNGSGKSTAMAAAACAYSTTIPREYFFTSNVGDLKNYSWELEYEVISKEIEVSDTVHIHVKMTTQAVERTPSVGRPVKHFGINRTLSPVTSPFFMRRHLSETVRLDDVRVTEIDARALFQEAGRVLGKDLSAFKLLSLSIPTKRKVFKKTKEQVRGKASHLKFEIRERRSQELFVSDGKQKYSEFGFGAGEASVLRLIHDTEKAPEQSLVLIEEIENGLHPLAVERLVQYFIDVAIRRKVQVLFTTHSDYALRPLPQEAVWSALDGRLLQGSLSIESLRAISGRIDKKLAIFTEDSFAQKWLEAVLREGLKEKFDEVGVYHLTGDSTAIQIHLAHNKNPAVSFGSICFLDGDSKESEDYETGIYRLPGRCPESFVFNTVLESLMQNAAFLTMSCQRPITAQQDVIDAVRQVASTNRDWHLLFAQVGALIGFVSEEIVRGAFLATWINESPRMVQEITDPVLTALQKAQPRKT